ncbi:hypothetical protein ACI2K4_18050 [Micromonospora sp. NPDC050397]|uniref:hypothetical protein n=1 Tax=Micromonospora sp. NPDC050397 TaxID=3364279 RepID=UPI00384F15AC
MRPDSREHHPDPRDRDIVAAYAEGQPVATIAELYRLTERDVERIIAGLPPTWEPGRVSPPAPVIAAVGLVGFAATVTCGRLVLLAFNGGDAFFLVGCVAVLAACHAAIGYGLWRGWRGPYWITIGVSVLAVLLGFLLEALSPWTVVVAVALVGLLALPAPARAWFRPN